MPRPYIAGREYERTPRRQNSRARSGTSRPATIRNTTYCRGHAAYSDSGTPNGRTLPPGTSRLYKVAWVASCVLYDRDKLLRSVQIALRKRPVEPERIDQVVSKIVRELESQGESEISSETVGEAVMEALRQLDDVAYVRFASVYRNFREAKDFEAVLDELSSEEGDKPPALARK